MRKSYILLMAVLVSFFNAFSQETVKTLDEYIRSRTYDIYGKEMVEIIVPGKPPDNHREPVAIPLRSAVLLSNVPAFDWSFGCSATSASMAAGFYDNNGYPDMYTGPTNGGVMPMNNSIWGYVVINDETRAQCPLSATRNTIDGRTTRGHVDDYWIQYGSTANDPYITNGWTQHTYGECTGDYMGTNQSAFSSSDGSTTFYNYTDGSPLYNYTGCEPGQIDGCHGFRDFYESRGYDVVQNYSQYIYGYNGNTLGFTFNQYKQEINAGRPVLIQVEGHTMLGYGYDDAGTLVYLHDTWDYNNHTMTWGGSYSGLAHYGVCVVQIEPSTVIPTANFSAGTTTPLPGVSVTFTDLSTGNPVSWLWVFSPNTVTYLGGTTSTSQNPQVSFNNSGYYTVSLTVTNANGSDTETKSNYIHACSPGLWTGTTSIDWNTASNWDNLIVPISTTSVSISPDAVNWPTYSGNFTVGAQCSNMIVAAGSEIEINGNFTINAGYSLIFSGDGELSISGDWTNNGTFIPGSGTINFFGATSSTINATATTVANYGRNTFTKGMTTLTGATTVLATGDDASAVIPIGFTFNYSGASYTSARICTNGWMSLNQSGTISPNNPDLFTATVPNTTLAPWWDDLLDDGTSKLYYKTEGSSPNRVFTAEWNKVKTYYNVATARISFQVKLFETTNVIEFHYGNLETGTHSSSEGASIGIEDGTGGSGHFIEATTGSTTTGVINLVSTTNWPAINYRFTPSVPLQTFQNITISKSSANVDFNTNTVVESSFYLLPGASFKILSGKMVTVGE